MNNDLLFLKKLQEELNTQEIDSQAAPRFWTVGDYRMVPAYEGCGDCDYISVPLYEFFNSLEEFIDYIDEDVFNELGAEAKSDFEIALDNDELLNWIKDYLDEDAELFAVSKEHFVHPNTMFLTKEEAKEHIRLNHYHYTEEAHTYAMTAWRAPKVERLLNIIETMDFSKLNVK